VVKIGPVDRGCGLHRLESIVSTNVVVAPRALVPDVLYRVDTARNAGTQAAAVWHAQTNRSQLSR